jgi:hypothetical protein
LFKGGYAEKGLQAGIMKNYREIFGNIDTEYYRKAAERFLPEKIRVLFIFESPPFPPPVHPKRKIDNPNWSYFYRFETKGSNNLRREVCRAVFNKKIIDHKNFLNEFCEQGYFLIDAVNYPINRIIEENKNMVKINSKGDMDNKEREEIIVSEANNLIKTIEYWADGSKTKISEISMLLVKVSVFNGLIGSDNSFRQKCQNNEYNVLNDHQIPFPMVPHNKKFIADVRELLNL